MVASTLARLRTMPSSAISRCDVAVGEPRDLRDVEALERAAEVLPLAQDDQPRQTTLEGLERHPLEQLLVAAQRTAPLRVVVVAIHDGIGCGRACSGDQSPTRSASARHRRRRRSRLLASVVGQRVSALETLLVARRRPRCRTPRAPRRARRAVGRVPGPADRAPSRPRGVVATQRLAELERVDVLAGDPEAGNTVAVVPRGSGGSRSPRPNSTLPTPNSTMATRISTTR